MRRLMSRLFVSSVVNFPLSRSVCRFSITRITSAHLRWPAVTRTCAPGSVPAERASYYGWSSNKRSAVRLRHLFWLQMKRRREGTGIVTQQREAGASRYCVIVIIESGPPSLFCLSPSRPACGPTLPQPQPQVRPRSCGGRILRCGPRRRAPCHPRLRRLRRGRPG